jgi:hypothetical protein
MRIYDRQSVIRYSTTLDICIHCDTKIQQVMSPDRLNMASNEQQPACYKSKWGNVTILDQDNYAAFRTTCQATLIIAQAWDITQGNEPQPTSLTTVVGKDWSIRRSRALQIMFNSTDDSIRTTLHEFMVNQDAPGMWNHLATFSHTSNDQLLAETFRKFQDDRFNPPQDSILVFAKRIRLAQEALRGTAYEQTDRQLFIHLIMRLPKTSMWELAYQQLLKDYTGFTQAVQYLRNIEQRLAQPDNLEATNTAHYAKPRRFQSRYSPKKNRSSKNHGNQNHSSESAPLTPEQCSWCLRNGHWRKDCRDYKRAQIKARGHRKEPSKNNQEDASINLAAYTTSL